ncbi:MAG: TonB-dependent receptor, partial [Bacteroidetes bacterium]|nr:TonB-dependent receptor [Bacteroidota bacterium]
MKKEKSVWAIVIIAFWCASPNHARAQQDSLAARQLEEVVVTATKFPKNLSETGKVLLIIDEEQLRRGAGKDIAQLLNEQAGVVINGANSNPGKDKAVYLRGASTQYTLILIDGVPVTDPSGIGGAFDLRLLPLDQIERIEVLKGSQSTLYGTDAVAGVINLITKKKQDQRLSGIAGMAGGSYGSMKGNVSLAGNAGKWDYCFGYSGFRSDGISEAKDPGNTGTFDNDGFTQHSFQASAGFQATRTFVLRPSFRYNTFDGRYDEGPFTDSKINSFQTRLINAALTSQYD